MTPNKLFFLVSVRYKDECSKIIVEFANDSHRIYETLDFTPAIISNLSRLSQEELQKLINETFLYSVNAEFLGNSIFSFSSKSMEILKSFQEKLASLNCNSLLIPPEKQFLLSNNWAYFNCFKMVSGKLRKLDTLLLPNSNLGFLVHPLPLTISQLNGSNKASLESLLKRVILSNVLSLGINEISFDSGFIQKSFLESIFFRQKFIPSFPYKPDLGRKKSIKGSYSNITEVNFSSFFADALTKNFYNLWFDTYCCDCCKPNSISSKNLLPNSTVQVRFVQDGIFLQSFSNSFAESFHENHGNKFSRQNYMDEFYLNSVPLGPFNSEQTVELPLHDVIPNLDKNHFSIIELAEPKWFCTKRESFLSRHIRQMKISMMKLSKRLEFYQSKSLKKGLASYNNLLNTPIYLFLEAYLSELDSLLGLVVNELTSNSSGLLSKEILESYSAIQSYALGNFKEFSAMKGSKAILATPSAALLNSDSALALVKEFSIRFSYPLPKIGQRYEFLSF